MFAILKEAILENSQGSPTLQIPLKRFPVSKPEFEKFQYLDDWLRAAVLLMNPYQEQVEGALNLVYNPHVLERAWLSVIMSNERGFDLDDFFITDRSTEFRFEKDAAAKGNGFFQIEVVGAPSLFDIAVIDYFNSVEAFVVDGPQGGLVRIPELHTLHSE